MILVGIFFRGSIFFGLMLPPIVLTAVMFSYQGYCFNTLRLSPEETGDSLYYMGFLFTATSLAAGIVVIGIILQRGHDEQTAGDAIVSFLPSFGVALVTTIVGLCLRVVLSQGAGDVDSEYVAMKGQLHQAAADLTQQANLTTDQFATLMTMMQQKATEMNKNIVGFSDTMQSSFDRTKILSSIKNLDQAARTLSKAADQMKVNQSTARDLDEGIKSAIDDLSKASTGHAKHIIQAINRQTESMNRLSQRLRASTRPAGGPTVRPPTAGVRLPAPARPMRRLAEHGDPRRHSIGMVPLFSVLAFVLGVMLVFALGVTWMLGTLAAT